MTEDSDFEEAEKLADACDALREIGKMIFGNVAEDKSRIIPFENYKQLWDKMKFYSDRDCEKFMEKALPCIGRRHLFYTQGKGETQ